VSAVCALGVLLLLVNLGSSGEDKELRAVIDKALEAQGGAAKLAKFEAQTMKGAGKFYGMGEPIDYTIEIASHKERFRFGLQMTVMNFDVKIALVVNGAKGWMKINDDVQEMPDEELAEQKEQMHCNGVVSLLPLKDTSYKLSTLGDVKVGDQPAIGVRVSKEGRRDVNLYFDKANGYLIKSEFMIKDIKNSGDKEIAQASYYSDYKEFQGTRHPTRSIIERDGKKFVDTQVSELQLLEKLDESTFNRP
jgi:hypothetical protein